LIVTGDGGATGPAADKQRAAAAQVAKIRGLIGFSEVYQLHLPPARLDALPLVDVVERFSSVFNAFQPEEVLPHRSDVHTDHRVVFAASAACSKWFRHPSVRRVLAYETVSETEFGLDAASVFRPNTFVDISQYLEAKLQAMAVYKSELDTFPFPRSLQAIRAVAMWRGSNSGFAAAEAFELLRERL